MKIDLPSLQVKNELNPKLWEGWNLKSDIKHRLILIAEDFLDFAGMGDYEDIQFTGSMANFNWSSASDIDLHPIIDFMSIDENIELVRELLLAKKTIWNSEHDVRIHGIDVECYAQHISDPHHSTGIYSLIQDKWIVKPSMLFPTVNLDAVRKKAGSVKKMIDDAFEEEGCNSYCLDDIKAKIKKMRQCGLERGGEFSIENLAYKVLRRNGYLSKLWDTSTEMRDTQLSIK